MRRVVQVGYTDAPLVRAGIVVDTTMTEYAPLPTSRDPVYPGVLLELSGDTDQMVMWVNSFANRRYDDGTRGLDGPGTILKIRRLDSAGFAGRYHPAGGLRGGTGYFCARLVKRASLRGPEKKPE